MIAIAAVDRNWGIGRAGGLLAHIPEDLKYFRWRTLGQVVIMGRKTLESLPGGRPLPERDTIVLTRNPDYRAQGAEVYHSVAALLDALPGEHFGQEIYVAGGAEIYAALLPHCEGALITKIDADLGADTFFPRLDDMEEFELGCQGDSLTENGLTFRFTDYRRKR